MCAMIAGLVQAIPAYDALEQKHIAATCGWIASGAPICRVAKPDVPPQHLVSYFVLVDRSRRQLLLVDHKKSGLWLPGGGHVEPDEHPQTTVSRELTEELGLTPAFVWHDPLFLTVARTVGTTAGHTDVSLWYVLDGICTHPLRFDADEFHAVRWFAFDAIPWERTDPHMQRFVAKLRSRLARDAS